MKYSFIAFKVILLKMNIAISTQVWTTQFINNCNYDTIYDGLSVNKNKFCESICKYLNSVRIPTHVKVFYFSC